ncbi:hypothetical protein COLO4_21514 [Corchorus olitorius]|uniref:Bifunctional inhibitor/plant lipid transfer protein/seed storage helical domain-containing protein n=1 Tax=Corchorus olitorius TaxID=93759 RepID=A0A1R3ISV6_9ROSI|nr:hypothetical protein COLO4_21514 [Corchorus olitorius]
MELSKLSASYIVPLVLVIALSASVNAQITTPCNPSMLSSFTPCMNFLTNSSGNGTSPTADCCNSLKNLTNGGMDCLCLIVTGSVPFQLPINRTLAISLPRACNMPGVPVKCKAPAGAPIPAPGPTSLAPTLSPAASPTLSPSGPIVPEPTPSAESPESDTTPTLTPPSSTVGSEAPTATTGSRPVLTPSTANPSHSFAPIFVVLSLGFVIFKQY